MSRTIQKPTSIDPWLHEKSNWDQKHDDREYTPRLFAANQYEQAWRIPRLVRVYEMAKQLFLKVENRPLPATIVTDLSADKWRLVVTVLGPGWQAFPIPFFQIA